MIMTVDTGNKMIKTDTLEFNAGVEILDQMPGEREEVILYEGQYYITTSRRISYMEDKTEDERYFILTLFAIGKEMEAMETQERMIPNGLIEIELLVGLPPAHYGKHRRTTADPPPDNKPHTPICIPSPQKIQFYMAYSYR